MFGRNRSRSVQTGSVNVGACGPQGCGVGVGGANSGFGQDWGLSAYGYGQPINPYDPYYSWAVAQARGGIPGVYAGQDSPVPSQLAMQPGAMSAFQGAGIPAGIAPPGSFGSGWGGQGAFGGGAPWMLNNCFPCGPCGPQFGSRRGPRKTKAGIPRTIIQGGATATLLVQPNVVFTGTSLEFPAEAINSNVLLLDLKVGPNSQMPLGPVPLNVYSQVSTDQEMDMDTCQVGQSIALVIQNAGVQPVTIVGAIDGYAFFC